MSSWDERAEPIRLPVRLRSVDTVPMGTLPWKRRERADANIRRAIGDLRALHMEDPEWGAQYRALADAFDAAIRLLDAIEDMDSRRPRRLRVTL